MDEVRIKDFLVFGNIIDGIKQAEQAVEQCQQHYKSELTGDSRQALHAAQPNISVEDVFNNDDGWDLSFLRRALPPQAVQRIQAKQVFLTCRTSSYGNSQLLDASS
ncbi:hypothetical protein ACH5RR_021500 [Cinchona calisaya]|uniref:Uncharacterized protein n=1 Tax=Cinchona calisaya TaxID=153742 RepID=A0ABD2ZHH3_9GENT